MQIMDSVASDHGGACLPSTPQERVLNLTQEQIVGVPVPRIMKASVDVVLSTPQERVQHRTLEQIAEFPVPQFLGECVQNHTQEQIMNFPVPQNMEDYAGVVRATPQELVQNRSFVHQITDEIGDGVFGCRCGCPCDHAVPQCLWSRQCRAKTFTNKVVDIPILVFRTVEVPQIQSSTELNDNFEAERVIFGAFCAIFRTLPRGVESRGARIFRALDDEEFFVVEGSLGWRGRRESV